jgi:protein BCP1
VEFCIESMQDDDYFTMKNLLRGYLQETSFNSGELVDLMLAQREKLGSSITVVGQEEMFGFMSVLDTHEHWDKASVQAVLKYVLGRVGTSSQVEEWKRVLGKKDSRIGLVVSERIANLPDHLAPHLSMITFNELAHMSPAPQYNYFLIVTNTYKQGMEDEDPNMQAEFEDGDDKADRPKKKRKNHQNLASSSSVPSLDPTVHYYKPEDEIFKECALLTHSTRVIKNNQQNRWTLQMYTQQSKLFLLVAADQLPRMLAKFKTMALEVEADLKSKVSKK